PSFRCSNGILCAIFCLFTIFTSTLMAQSPNQWRQLTPLEGGTVTALVSEGGRFFAGTNIRGIFVSTDNGKTWREANNGLGNFTIISLAGSGGNVMAANNAGIYRSGDGGQRWTLAGTNTVSTRVFATTDAGIFAGGVTGRVLRSTDNGQSWSLRGVIPNSPIIYGLAVVGDNLFAATFNGMFRSADQGQTWVGVNAGLPNSEQPIVFALAVKGNDLYIGTSLY